MIQIGLGKRGSKYRQVSEMDVLLLVICNSVKMGIRLCYKWEKPE
jgi:hypothetical protein